MKKITLKLDINHPLWDFIEASFGVCEIDEVQAVAHELGIVRTLKKDKSISKERANLFIKSKIKHDIK